jgi:hypothetical protein
VQVSVTQRALARRTDAALACAERDPALIAVPAKIRFSEDRDGAAAHGFLPGGLAGRILAIEYVAIQLDVLLQVRRHVFLGEDRGNGTFRLARSAVDAFIRMYVKLLRTFVNAVHRTNVNARFVFYANARFCNYVGHLFLRLIAGQTWKIRAAAPNINLT